MVVTSLKPPATRNQSNFLKTTNRFILLRLYNTYIHTYTHISMYAYIFVDMDV